MHIRTLIFALVLPLATQICNAQEITVAAAADLQFAMQDMAAQFHKQTGKTVKVIYGSSGNFFQQIQNGAPFDMFFSANLDYPRKLQTAGLIAPGSFYQYARGRIVLWVMKSSKLDLTAAPTVLLNPAITKIAIANPQHAPYGQAAVAAMQHEGIYDKIKDKLVLGENISQAASFVVTGTAEVGIVALSLALSPNLKDKGRFLEIPASEYPPIEQAVVILNSSKNEDVAQQFLGYIRTTAAAAILQRYGFDVSR